jgi:hypothetical protein
MAEMIVFLTVVCIIALLLYLAKNLNPELNFVGWLFILLIIPLGASLSSIAVDNSLDCALVYDDVALTLTKVCTGSVSTVAIWLLKIMTFLMYVEVMLMFIGLLVMGYQAIVSKGGYFK